MTRKIVNQDGSPSISGDAVWIGRALSDPRYGIAHPAPRLRDHSKESHQRISIRAEVPYQAVINYGMSYSGAWRVRDISMSGAFVEMDIGDLQEGTSVEFVIRFRHNERSIEHRLPATAIRIQHNGVALKFGHYDDNAYTDLINLLYAR